MPRLAEFHTVLLFTPQRSLGKREVSYQQEVCLADDDVSLSHSVFSDLVNAIRGLLGLNPKPRTNPPWASCQTPPAPSPPGAQGLRGAMHHFQSAPPSPTFIMVQGSSEKRGSGRTVRNLSLTAAAAVHQVRLLEPTRQQQQQQQHQSQSVVRKHPST